MGDFRGEKMRKYSHSEYVRSQRRQELIWENEWVTLVRPSTGSRLTIEVGFSATMESILKRYPGWVVAS